jgi:ethanolamine utilization microcompartment shell protein EutL
MLNPTQIIEPEWLLPFEGMAIGESFFIPTLRPAELIYSIDCGSKRAKVRVKSYVTTKEGYLGVRCWRTA